MDLVGKVLDCVRETSKDVIDYDASRPAMTSEDVERVEAILDLLADDLQSLVAQLAALEEMPDMARQQLDIVLRTDKRCRQALRKLEDLAGRFDRLEVQNRQILVGQGYAAGMLEDMLPVMRRLAGVMDFIEDLMSLQVPAAVFQEQLHRYRLGVSALGQGCIGDADVSLDALAAEQPRSAAVLVARGAAHAAGMDLDRAKRSLEAAVRLRPEDAELAELNRRVTRVATPPWPGSGTPAPKVGDTLDGWRLDELLGRGGMGQVFRATRDGRSAALKVLNADLSRDPAFVERFKREIMALIQLGGHPHLVKFDTFGYAADRSCWYFVMELIDGISLQHHLTRYGALSPDKARRLFLAVADGLALAHARGSFTATSSRPTFCSAATAGPYWSISASWRSRIDRGLRSRAARRATRPPSPPPSNYAGALLIPSATSIPWLPRCAMP